MPFRRMHCRKNLCKFLYQEDVSNMKTAKPKSRVVAVFFAVILLVSSFAGTMVSAENTAAIADETTHTLNSLADMANLMVSITYKEYLDDNVNAHDCDDGVEIAFLPEDLDREASTSLVGEPAKEKYVLNEGTVNESEKTAYTYTTSNDGRIVFNVTVPETAMYSIALDYYPIEGNGSTIERILLIDGKIPFSEARYMNFTRVWRDLEAEGYSVADRTFKLDVNKNEMRPVKYEKPRWRSQYLSDSQTFYEEPFKFFLKEGEHTIAFESASEPLKFADIRLCKAQTLPTYEEYLASHADAKPVSADISITVNAETPYETSEQVIYAMNDRTSAATVPQSTKATLLNTIGGNGGDKWKLTGQWISWEVDIPESGFYCIIPRFKQTVSAGLFASRAIRINGEYPFREAHNLQFKFGSDWQTGRLNDGTTEFVFYLEKGKNVIEMEAVLGRMATVLQTIDDSTDRLNEYYRKILMITGTDPDEYTDYQFSKLIPDVLRGMRAEAELLYQTSADMEAIIGQKGENTVILDRVAYLLDIMGNDQDKIAVNLDAYKSNIGSLGTWLLNTMSQPLQLDYLLIQPAENTKVPQADAGFFESFLHEINSFIQSFFVDYNSMGSSVSIADMGDNSIEVWITTGRDQANIMRQMVDDSFTAQYGVSVNLKLIAAGTLLPATLAGTGPDVSMDADPVGMGIRDAVVPLNYFENTDNYMDVEGYEHVLGFSEVKKLFNEESFVPLTVLDPDKREFVGEVLPIEEDDGAEFKVVNGVERNGVVAYGLPSTIDFPMLFYRKDVFVQLGLEVPETWDDVENVIRALSEHQLEMGVTSTLHQIRMYQTGTEWFKSCYDYEDYDTIDYNSRDYLRTVGIESNLGSNKALDAFQRMTEWFTLYGQPVAFDFANRFRTGELPIAISSFMSYNQMKCFAPEISGLWEFVQLPGVEKEDGTIDHTTPITVGAVCMMKDATKDLAPGEDVTESRRAINSWKYLQWWVGTEAQERFGKEQVAIMGTAAKYASANVEALKGQSWTAQEKRNLDQQFKSLKGTPMSPGNYIVARYTNFAFYAVVDGTEVASEAMLGYVDDIDNELTRKRVEYGFLTADDYKASIGLNEAES